MNMSFFYVIITVLLVSSLLVSRIHVASTVSQSGFFLGNRKIGLFSLTLTFLASQLGGGVIVGTSEIAYNYGWYAIYYPLGLSLGLIALATGIGAKFRRLSLSTIPEIFLSIYKSRSLQFFSAIIMIFATFCILVALGVASKKFALAVGMENNWIFLSIWFVIIIYTSFGGLNSVVSTDILQIIFIIAALILSMGTIIWQHDINISYQHSVDIKQLPWSSWILMPMLFVIIGQDMGQRCFAARDPKTVSLSTVIAGLLLGLSAIIPVMLGIMANNLEIELSNQSVIIDLVARMANPYIASGFAAAILLAILSTADSLICSISSNISYDLYSVTRLTILTKNVRLITFIVGVVAIVVSLYFKNILTIMVFAYEMAACCLFVPIIMAVVFNNSNYRSAACSVIIGGLSFITLAIIFELDLLNSIYLNSIAYYKGLLSIFLAWLAFIGTNFK